ncbi:Queuine tRNA-ribosyltransferase subunit qtrtd1 [Linnemannia schmuckeri]|uniref:Queuine tRNA-ribosyltransferase accessory subunit 2 n=1 Tax=Linnemannia schmuckeri TaxID=64567 RepID=A0A9P5S3L3_9FUNG|nr:Queuine tRNA-ribosyltransferase subunit qtrtd1 [Linnemannia schmuckeri]
MPPLTFNIIRQSTQRTAARRGTLVMTQAATATANTNNSTIAVTTSATTSSTNANGNAHEHNHVADNKEPIKRVIETPGCFMHTVKGTVPHLTPDTMRLQGFGGVHVSIEQLLQDHQPGGFDKWPFTLSKFLNLQDMILLCDLRDPSRYVKVPVNSDRYVAIKTHKGVRQLTLEEYLKIIRAYQPDIVAAMADQITDADASAPGTGRGSVSDGEAEAEVQGSPSSRPGLNRVKRSVDRSLRWLDQILLDRQGMDAFVADRAAEEAKRRKMKKTSSTQSHDSTQGVDTLTQETQKLDLVTRNTTKVAPRIPWPGVSMFAHVLGSHVEQERIRSAQETARREAVDGFIVDTNPLQGSSKETILNLLKVSLDHLPAEKPRMVYGLQAPEDVLKSIALGADLFDTSYPFHLTADGKASLYSFGSNNNFNNSITNINNSPTPGEATTNRWINLWDDEHANKFVPLLEGCGCYACKGGRHTRAYINHLLKAHEMLATVLLMSHNMYQYSKFFANVRQSIQDGTFEQYSASFVEQFGSEPERTGEIHAAQAIVEAALSKRSRLDGSNSNSASTGRSSRNGDSNSDCEGEQGAMSKEEKAEARRKLKEQERFERRERNRMEGLKRKKEKQQTIANIRELEETPEP